MPSCVVLNFLCSLGSPHRDPPSFAPPGIGIKACTTMPKQISTFMIFCESIFLKNDYFNFLHFKLCSPSQSHFPKSSISPDSLNFDSKRSFPYHPPSLPSPPKHLPLLRQQTSTELSTSPPFGARCIRIHKHIHEYSLVGIVVHRIS